MSELASETLVDLVERLIVAGVAITTVAIAEARPDLDLTFAQWRALLIIGRADDGLTISAVARRIGTTLPATSRQVHRLERRGLVLLATDEGDRRATRVRLTSAGEAWRREILDRRRRTIQDALAADERADPLAQLTGIVDRLEALATAQAARSSKSDRTASDERLAVAAGKL